MSSSISLQHSSADSLEQKAKSVESDKRVVMTLDAGGTSFRFSAMQGGKAITETITMPPFGDQLYLCLETALMGFEAISAQCPTPPVAISFAFPGPADYPAGVIGSLGNLPGFRGEVPLGPLLEEKFGIPVFINNDGDLFAYGETTAGLLPQVNKLLAQSGSSKRFRNLLGVTLGTGFGGGIVQDGNLFQGDNSISGEINLVRGKVTNSASAEEGACIRAIRRAYAEAASIHLNESPDPKVIAEIATGQGQGNQEAAIDAFEKMGEVAGDAIANALTLIDGLAVIGGGLSNSSSLFLPRLVQELNSSFQTPQGSTISRLSCPVYNLEDPESLKTFLTDKPLEIPIPGSTKTFLYDSFQRLGIGVSRLGTSHAITLGAYAFALDQLDSKS